VKKLLLVFILCFGIVEAKPPTLSPKDTRVKIDEILKAHVSHHMLTPELIRRAFLNYLEELDPTKTYFLESEVVRWTDPSDDMLEQTIVDYRQERFTHFEAIHEAFFPAVERRNALEAHLAGVDLPKGVQPSEFKELAWLKSAEELSERLLRIRALQLDSMDKLDQGTRDQFLSRLEKRRLNREVELSGQGEKQRHQQVLSFVLKSVSGALDSQTAYFTPAEANQFMVQVQQRLFGIGAQLRDDLNGFTITRILEGGPPSTLEHLKIGDKIIGVNNEPVVGMDIVEAVELIRGPKGSPVLLTLLREHEGSENEQRLDVEITRGEVVLKETRFETATEPFGDGSIGILRLFSFYQDSKTSSANDLMEAIVEMKSEHTLKGIILDLRNNAGGLLPQAVAVTGLFIKKGIVVSVKDNTGDVQHLRNIEGKMGWEGPLIVLTNKTSASAAEIVAQTLQDYGRALVVGDKTTYGKGTFQTFTLESANYGKINPKGEYKVTRGRYYTVSGKSPQLVGVSADIEVPGYFSQLDIGEKFSKYPLENDAISPNFEDDFSDIPPAHRNQIIRLYKFNLQTVSTQYTPYKELLQKNSATRIQQNKNYQNFIKEISNRDEDAEPENSFGQTDLQLVETYNIMKDLILLEADSGNNHLRAAG
jgi:carboxyl-terminal processing protease